jgi:hypothetical protein
MASEQKADIRPRLKRSMPSFAESQDIGHRASRQGVDDNDGLDLSDKENQLAAQQGERYKLRKTGSTSSTSLGSNDGAPAATNNGNLMSMMTPLEKKAAHLESEKKRRQNINRGFEDLRAIVPSCSVEDSKADVLRKTAAYIRSCRHGPPPSIQPSNDQGDDYDEYDEDIEANAVDKKAPMEEEEAATSLSLLRVLK